MGAAGRWEGGEGVAQEVVGWGVGEVRKETAGPTWPQESDGLIRALRESLRGLRVVGCGSRALKKSPETLKAPEEAPGLGRTRVGGRELIRERQVYLY